MNKLPGPHSYKLAILCLLQMAVMFSYAQNFVVSGTIEERQNGETLTGATVTVKEMPGISAVSNEYGFYSISLPKGKYTLLVNSIGFSSTTTVVDLNKDTRLNVKLVISSVTMNEVVVTAKDGNKNVRSASMGTVKFTPRSIETIPVIFGEKDIIKTLQLTPGVKSAGEGNTGFYVRGGGADQNLVLLDEANVYNASHLLGFFSVFNSDAVKDVTLYKSGIPAEYGGRASSVLDVKMRDGNNQQFGVSGGLGLISSRLTLEAPIVKDKGSFILSGRRSYADVFLKLSNNENTKNSTLYFYDMNLKANYKISKKDKLYLSGYFGRDNFTFSKQFGFDWGNGTATARLNHLYSNKLFSNTSFIYSNYNYRFNIGEGAEALGIRSAIRDLSLKQDFTHYVSNSSTLKYGIQLTYHTFLPGELIASDSSSFNSSTLKSKYALEGGIYLQNDQKISEKISLMYGLRYSMFNYMGKGTAYTYDAEGNKTSERDYKSGESIQYYGGLEPRISARYQLNNESSVKLSFNRNYQYLHLLTNASTSSPTDLWVPSSNNIKPQIANQLAVGYFRNFRNNMFEFSFETYYKRLQNQVDYRNGAELILNNEVESGLVYGKGKAYGAEFYLKKTRGDLGGWIGYTLSRTMRQVVGINNGNYYPARQDRIHDISVVAIYRLNKKVTLSANWVFNTGDAATFPSGSYEVNGLLVPYYTERNGYRFPNYHRMDVGLTWYRKKKKRFESSWNFSIYNVYNRENAYTITFRQNEDDPTKTEAVQTTLFRIVPSITYNFKF